MKAITVLALLVAVAPLTLAQKTNPPKPYHPPAPSFQEPSKQYQADLSKRAKAFTGKPCTGHFLYRQFKVKNDRDAKEVKSALDKIYLGYKQPMGVAQKVLKSARNDQPPKLQAYIQGGHLFYGEVVPVDKNTFSDASCNLN